MPADSTLHGHAGSGAGHQCDAGQRAGPSTVSQDARSLLWTGFRCPQWTALVKRADDADHYIIGFDPATGAWATSEEGPGHTGVVTLPGRKPLSLRWRPGAITQMEELGWVAWQLDSTKADVWQILPFRRLARYRDVDDFVKTFRYLHSSKPSTVYDAARNRIIGQFDGKVIAVAATGAGAYRVARCEGDRKVFEVSPSGTKQIFQQPHDCEFAALTADGKTAAWTWENSIEVFDLGSGKRLGARDFEGAILAVDFDPAGRLVAVHGGQVEFWTWRIDELLATGKRILEHNRQSMSSGAAWGGVAGRGKLSNSGLDTKDISK